MSEELGESKIDVFETRRFEKQMNKLSDSQREVVEDEIDYIIDNPEIGNKKKGDLSHLRVHKFKLDNQEVLLGYSMVQDKMELYLLSIGPHENFYTAMKKSRKTDLKIIG